MAYAAPDGDRQAAIGVNLQRYQALDEEGNPVLHPADAAMYQHLDRALCGAGATAAPPTAVPWLTPVEVALP